MPSDQALNIAALIERLGRMFSSDAHAEGLLPVHWEALRYLSKANQFSRTHAALTAYLGLTKGTVSQTLTALESKGLIRKQADSKDRRSKRLVLTPRGRGLLKRDPVKVWLQQLDTLPKAERTALEQTLLKLLHERLAARDRALFGQCGDCMYFVGQHADGAPHYCDLLKTALAAGDAELICVEQQPGRQNRR